MFSCNVDNEGGYRSGEGGGGRGCLRSDAGSELRNHDSTCFHARRVSINLTRLHISVKLVGWRVVQFPWKRQRELSLAAVPVATDGGDPSVNAGVCPLNNKETKYRHYSSNRHYSLFLALLVVIVCAKRFLRSYSGQPAP